MNRGDFVWHKFKEPDKKTPCFDSDSRRGDFGIELDYCLSDYVEYPGFTIASNTYGRRWDAGDLRFKRRLDSTVPKQNLESFITHLPDNRLDEVFVAIKFAFGFDK